MFLSALYLNDGEDDNDDEEEECDVESKSSEEVVFARRVHFVSDSTARSQSSVA